MPWRFFLMCGPAKLLCSDKGTNFVDNCKELDMGGDATAIRKNLQEKGCSWVFNPAHASHMGGTWEKLIRVARCILDAVLLQKGMVYLTDYYQCHTYWPRYTHSSHTSNASHSEDECSLSPFCKEKRLFPASIQLHWMESSGNMSNALLTPFGTGEKESVYSAEPLDMDKR